jgi:hypothetical protein
MVLRDIDDIVHAMGKNIHTYGLPELDDHKDEEGYHNREVREQYSLGVDEEDLKVVHNLNPEQLSSFVEIIDHVRNRKGRVFFVEVAMTKRQAVESLDRSMQEIMGSALPFGGKVMVFGGDFRQVLPVVARGTRTQIMDATLLRSYIWKDICKISLTRNMRAKSDP